MTKKPFQEWLSREQRRHPSGVMHKHKDGSKHRHLCAEEEHLHMDGTGRSSGPMVIEVEPPKKVLPTFDSSPMCTKCGDGDVKFEFRANFWIMDTTLKCDTGMCNNLANPEHMHVRCLTCGHTWVTQALDDQTVMNS